MKSVTKLLVLVPLMALMLIGGQVHAAGTCAPSLLTWSDDYELTTQKGGKTMLLSCKGSINESGAVGDSKNVTALNGGQTLGTYNTYGYGTAKYTCMDVNGVPTWKTVTGEKKCSATYSGPASDPAPISTGTVCGQPPMPICTSDACVQVMPAPKTYESMATLNTAGATFLKNGACTITTPQPPIVPPSTTGSCTYKVSQVLALGDGEGDGTTNDVMMLQRILMKKGLLVITNGVPTGYYGNMTMTAVKAFQTSEGLPATGNVDTATMAKLNVVCTTGGSSTPFLGTSCVAPAQTLALGDGEGDTKAADVSKLQKILITGGYLKVAAPTGYYGNMTMDAVKKLQAAFGVPQTGVFDGAILAKVKSVCVASSSTATPTQGVTGGVPEPEYYDGALCKHFGLYTHKLSNDGAGNPVYTCTTVSSDSMHLPPDTKKCPPGTINTTKQHTCNIVAPKAEPVADQSVCKNYGYDSGDIPTGWHASIIPKLSADGKWYCTYYGNAQFDCPKGMVRALPISSSPAPSSYDRICNVITDSVSVATGGVPEPKYYNSQTCTHFGLVTGGVPNSGGLFQCNRWFHIPTCPPGTVQTTSANVCNINAPAPVPVVGDNSVCSMFGIGMGAEQSGGKWYCVDSNWQDGCPSGMEKAQSVTGISKSICNIISSPAPGQGSTSGTVGTGSTGGTGNTIPSTGYFCAGDDLYHNGVLSKSCEDGPNGGIACQVTNGVGKCSAPGNVFINGNEVQWKGNTSGYCYADSACDAGYTCNTNKVCAPKPSSTSNTSSGTSGNAQTNTTPSQNSNSSNSDTSTTPTNTSSQGGAISGYLSGTACTVPVGDAECVTTVSWSVNGLPTNGSITAQVSSGSSFSTTFPIQKNGLSFSGTQKVSVKPGSYSVKPLFSGITGYSTHSFASGVFTASCASGSTWNGSLCASNTPVASCSILIGSVFSKSLPLNVTVNSSGMSGVYWSVDNWATSNPFQYINGLNTYSAGSLDLGTFTFKFRGKTTATGANIDCSPSSKGPVTVTP